MSEQNTAAEVIAQLLIDQGIGSVGGAGGGWPVYVNALPDEPGACIGVFDTTGTKDSRAMSGEVQDRAGVQVRVRHPEHVAGHIKAHTVEALLDAVQRTSVTLTTEEVYFIDVVTRTTTVVVMGPDDEKRSNFAVNAKLLYTQTS